MAQLIQLRPDQLMVITMPIKRVVEECIEQTIMPCILANAPSTKLFEDQGRAKKGTRLHHTYMYYA
jgi:hypothetical protein